MTRTSVRIRLKKIKTRISLINLNKTTKKKKENNCGKHKTNQQAEEIVKCRSHQTKCKKAPNKYVCKTKKPQKHMNYI